MAYGLSTRAFIEDGPVEQVAKLECHALDGALLARAQRSLPACRSSNRRSAPPTTASTDSRSRSDAAVRRERMVTMIDEIYDRHYREGRDRAECRCRRMASAASARRSSNAFEVLVGIEYSAPWAAKPERARCN